ncbi:MAG TPA: group II intron reverse transcriptase/maturase [Candidatus Lokiarchaeia archaeon]|nr:group II intron reverse transcriptase/maturase [Candidatus Lokiarchaeia archaeon]
MEEIPESRERLDRGRDDFPAQELTCGLAVDWGQGTGNWTPFERRVRRLQERTFRASREGKWRKMKHLQRLLALSWTAKVLAIRDVTERSSGRFTPGIDGKVYLTADVREQLCREKFDYRTHQPSPSRRSYIPKPSGGKRPLGIPIMRDRVMQAIVKMALEPEWEAKFAADSYGFRPGRSCHDAIEAIYQVIREMEKRGYDPHVLEADIASSFDRIAHDPLLGRLHLFRDVVGRWLKVGVVESEHYEPAEEGTPQGGVISPLLANIALDGIEDLFAGKWWARVVRYADDFVVVAATSRIIERTIRPTVERFLAERGLELNPQKSGTVNLSAGFNFLGFTTRKLGGKLLITPQKEKVQRFLRHLKAILVANKQATHKGLLVQLNPAIRGWANYFRHCNAKRTFSHVDHLLYWKIWWWARRRHPNKSKAWVRQKYFQGTEERYWAFGEKYITSTQGGNGELVRAQRGITLPVN